MKKKTTIKKNSSYKQKEGIIKAEEPTPVYNRTVKVIPQLKDFTYSEFKKISDKTPFTQGEWATMLHVSERTLQRYAKNNGSFAPINAERAMQIDKVLKEAKITFGTLDNFYNWLKNEPSMLGGNLSLESLTTSVGIERLLTQLYRIQHGLFA